MSENGHVPNGTLAKNRPFMDRFLEKLRESGNVRLSCEAAGLNRRTVYRWRETWVTFADEWQEALDDALDTLEGEAWRRARKNSDRLLMFLLQAHRPERFGTKVQHDHDVKGGLTITYVNDWRDNLPTDAT